ncbi:MAG: VWA domain-containing protein [Pyrinomonadaceae bacterium]|nr:VWA domain-containing protein [Pyrinomonadaceae bacterium]
MKTPLCLLLVCLLALSTVVRAQQPQQQTEPPTTDVLRISTELVQTDVMVFDKQGRFVDGLKKEDFEVRADGQPVEVNLFDRVVAGSPREEAQVQAARGLAKATAFRGSLRGRSIIFFIDDMHLSAPSVEKTRRAILQFIENDMGPLDQVAIASATGQIGFLQQFSDNKAVLRAAIARLNHRSFVIEDVEQIKMTEYNALRISQGDKDTLDYYTTELLKATNYSIRGGGAAPQSAPGGSMPGQQQGGRPAAGMSRQQAEGLVKGRANIMLKQSTTVTNGTLSTLESLMRSSSQLPGRKLVFLISDGFYLVDRTSGANDWVRRITDAAIRAGVVIYSLDARGLTNTGVDATSNRSDPTGRLARGNIGELAASQDGLNALAEDTGGRALFNSDTFNDAMKRAVRETSNYYLLAWKPASEEQKGGKFKRVEVSVKGRPELSVRLPRGYLEPDAAANANTARNEKTSASSKSEALKPAEADFRDALTAFAPKRGIPTLLSTSYLDTPNNGTVLTTSVQVASGALSYGADGKQPAAVDIAGVVLNDQGKPAASFKTRLNVNPRAADPAALDTASVIYNYKAPLKPGLYQVRVAARDDRSGRVGSSMQWIEVPDLAQKRLTLSSLLIGGQLIGSADKKQDAAQIQFSVDHRFQRSSHLGFWIFIYNAQLNAQGAPDVAAQVQIFRDGQSIVTTPQRKLSMAGMTDMARIPYGGDFALSGLPPGRYILQITITDRIANSSAQQRTSFDVE